MIKKCMLLVIIALLISFSSKAFPGGLSCKIGELWLENVRAGKAFSLKEALNMPVKVVNTSAQPVEIKMELFVNKLGDSDLREGYEPLPDPSWVKLTNEYFPKVEPNKEAETDIIIEIPKDKRYLGKKYQFYVWIKTVGGLKNVNIGVKSRFLITVISADNLAELEGRKKPDKIKANLDFSLMPYELFIKNADVGKNYDIEKEVGSALKIINPNAEKMKFKIYALTTEEAKTFLKSGYEDIKSSDFVTFKESEFTVPGESIKKIGCSVKFPKNPEYKGKKYQSVIVLEALDQDVNAKVYSRMYITTSE